MLPPYPRDRNIRFNILKGNPVILNIKYIHTDFFLFSFFGFINRREFGLERFVPSSLIEGMKRKELRRLMAHFLKLNSQMTGSSKMLTQLQVIVPLYNRIYTLHLMKNKSFIKSLLNLCARVFNPRIRTELFNYN